ncbi:unnamed protein product [Clonostachys chloroleuca]|uniref:Uncharacterized protein n=1 Tax=Clonostachys chloroleuca TaxID=1926264 RepID=A0AA35MGI6_9HYPO|nr:unnamed protein product [Clonostachys chloroleuca]
MSGWGHLKLETSYILLSLQKTILRYEFDETVPLMDYLKVPYWTRRKDCDFFMNKGSSDEASANATADLFQNQALRTQGKAAFKASQARLDTSAKANGELFEKVKELGVLREIDDSSSITGKSYQITDLSLFQVNMCWMAAQMLVLKMLFDCSVVYPEYTDPAALRVLLRKESVHVWNFIPALLELESFVAVTSLDVIYPTSEVAMTEEKEYLLDLFASLDRYRQALPTDRVLLNKAIVSYSALFSGRISPHAPLDFETCKWWKQKKAYKDNEAPPTLTHFMSPPSG